MSVRKFDHVVATYKSAQTCDNLHAFIVRAAALDKDTQAQHEVQRPLPFPEIHVLCDRHIMAKGIAWFAGCLAYALKVTLAGDELPEPAVCYPAAPSMTFTVMEFRYDSL